MNKKQAALWRERILAIDPATPLGSEEPDAPATVGEAIAGGFDALLSTYLQETWPEEAAPYHLEIAALNLNDRIRVVRGEVALEHIADGSKTMEDGRRVFADATIVFPDGSKILPSGELIPAPELEATDVDG